MISDRYYYWNRTRKYVTNYKLGFGFADSSQSSIPAWFPHHVFPFWYKSSGTCKEVSVEAICHKLVAPGARKCWQVSSSLNGLLLLFSFFWKSRWKWWSFCSWEFEDAIFLVIWLHCSYIVRRDFKHVLFHFSSHLAIICWAFWPLKEKF